MNILLLWLYWMSYETQIWDEDKLQNEWQLFLYNLNCNHSNQRLVMLEKKIEVYFSNITKLNTLRESYSVVHVRIKTD